MKYIRTITNFGGSTGLTMPQDLLNYLNLEKGDKISIEDHKDEYGTYIIVRGYQDDDKDTETTQ
jgi:antitoxin component of MazEF toxin-antitoxin module